MSVRWTIICGIGVLLAVTPSVGAEVASALLVEGDPLPGMVTETVTGLNNTGVNRVDGYAVTVTTTGPGGTLSHVWGSSSGGAGAILTTETTIGDYEQTSFESFFGIDDQGVPAYSASCTHVPSATTGMDSVWVGSTLILIEEDPMPDLPGYYSTFNSRPGITRDSQIYWVGGYSDTQGGSTQNRGIFYGAGATTVIKGGDSIPGIVEPIEYGSSVDFDVRFSALGSHWINQFTLDAATSVDGLMVMDGYPLLSDGSPVREGSPVPTAAGGLPGENWASFDFLGVTEAGATMVTGDTSGNTATDEFVMINGIITDREGDSLDGHILSGSIEGAVMNETLDTAIIWDVAGGLTEALIVNTDVVLLEGDPVDLDGDGTVEPDSILENFTGISAVTIGERDQDGWVDVYFTADIDTPDGTVEGFFRLTHSTLPPPVPTTGPIGLGLLALGMGLVLVRRRRG